MNTSDCMRTVHFRPYRKGIGKPTFTLKLYWIGGEKIGYRFMERNGRKVTVVFEGEDFRPSPMHCVDSDAAVAALMGFLTLRPGDTDADYFANYTELQHNFAAEHAETLSAEVYSRYGEQ